MCRYGSSKCGVESSGGCNYIVYGDIKEAADIFGAASFDVVTSNPPYMMEAWTGQSGYAKGNCET